MGKNKIVIGLLKIKQRTPAQYFQHKIFISRFDFPISQRINAGCFGLKLFIFSFLS